MENQELRQQYENYCKELKEKITYLISENEKTEKENKRLQRENELWKTYKEPKRDLELEIARLKDKLEFVSEQADTFAKALKVIYDKFEMFIEGGESISLYDLNQIKNSIPENALRRAE